jgi:hypothetical protein
MITSSLKAFITWSIDEIQKTEFGVSALEYVLKNRLQKDHGFQLEFGVWRGTTINLIANADFSRTVWGFDSFVGLPEHWRDGHGFFDLQGQAPKVSPNALLMKGWFSDTLPMFKEMVLKNSEISLLHIDCDIYSSTNTIFQYLENNITNETIVVFDELLNYPTYEDHEIKSLFEFCLRTNRKVEYIGTPSKTSEQVVCRIVS